MSLSQRYKEQNTGGNFCSVLKEPMKVNERVQFSLLMTPCCGQLLCWINPRMPNFCPECGTAIWLRKEGSHILHSDNDAWLRMEASVFDTEVDAIVKKNHKENTND